jgi:hypothetical protein
MWGALSDERTGLSFTAAAGPGQRSRSWVRVPNFTVSDLRLPFSSPPTTRTVTVEVFDPASTRVELTHCLRVELSWVEFYVTTDGQPTSLSWIKHPFGAYDQIFITCVTVTVLFLWGALSDERSNRRENTTSNSKLLSLIATGMSLLIFVASETCVNPWQRFDSYQHIRYSENLYLPDRCLANWLSRLFVVILCSRNAC